MPKNQIQERADGRKYYSVTDLSGKRIQIDQRKNEGRNAFIQRCNELDKRCEGVISHGKMKFDELYSKWEKEYQLLYCSKADNRVLRPLYNKHVKPLFGHRDIGKITRGDVHSFLISLISEGYSQSTVSKLRSCFSRPYNWAINTLNYSINAPTTGLIMKYKSKATEFLEEEGIRNLRDDEIDRFFKASINTKYHRYFLLLLLTGLRPSECLGLRKQDWTQSGIEIKRKISIDGLGELKTRSSYRTIPATEDITKLMFEQINSLSKGQQWLFPAENGKPSMNAIKKAFRYILKQTTIWKRGGRNKMKKEEIIEPPLEFTMYDFRHTFATRAAEIMPLKSLQTVMGHSNIRTTMNYYVGLTEKAMKKTAEQMQSLYTFNTKEKRKDFQLYEKLYENQKFEQK